LFAGVKSAITNSNNIDFVVVREGTEGLYVGAGQVKDQGSKTEHATEESINTYNGVERVIRYAFNKAKARPRKKLTLVHKNNVLVRAGGLWSRVFAEVAKDFPDVQTDYLHVDAAAMFFVTNPDRFDVVVTDNLFGDILTDIAAAICGGIGLAASGNINPTGKFPSMFEPVHGSAPDIAGKNLADPTATILSIAMMLEHLGLSDAAKDIETAVAQDLLNRKDQKRSTTEIGEALAKAVA
jgi:3-isopropylmalate dehydrogenase